MSNAWRHEPIWFAPAPRAGGGWCCFKDSPAAPAAPDYAGAAQAQGAANVDTARAQGRISNPNVFTPYGSQQVTWGAGAPQFNQAGYDQAQAGYQSALANYNAPVNQWGTGVGQAAQGPAPTAPTREQFTTTGAADQPTVTQTLAPAQQSLLDSQNRISQNLAGVAETGLNRVSQGMAQPFDTAGLPGQASSVAGWGTQGQGGQAGSTPWYESAGNFGAPGQGLSAAGQAARSGQNGNNYQTGVAFDPAQSSYNQGGDIARSTGYNGQIQNSFNAGSGARSSSGYGQPIQSQVANAGSQQAGLPGAGNVQSGLNFAGAPQLPGTNDFSADRDAVTNALMSRINPEFDRQEQTTRTRLMGQGLAAGSEASNYDLDTLNRARNDAQQQAVLAGGQEQSRLFGLASAARGQYTGEQATQGNFANQAQSQLYNQGLASGNFSNAAQQNQFGQNLQAGQFANTSQAQGFGQSQADLSAYNAAQAQNYAQNQGAAQFGNAAQAQGYTQAQGNAALQNSAQAQANQQNQAAAQFGNQAGQQNFAMGQQNAALNNQVGQQQFTQGLANANLTNQARQQAIQEQAYMRQLPLNELNALRTGSQVQNPQFQQFQGTNIGQTPVFQGAQAQGQANQGIYNAQAAGANSFNSGLMQTAATVAPYAIAAFSDRRLKSNIVRIGTHPLGIGWYEYDIFGQRTQGVMADEAARIKPEAVSEGPGGYLMVNYAAL